MNTMPFSAQARQKLGVFRQEAVAGVNGLGAGLRCAASSTRSPSQVGFPGWRRTDVHGSSAMATCMASRSASE